MKNGTCQKIENSLIAIFKLTSTTNRIHILNREENDIQISDIEMYVNGTEVTPFYHTERWWRNKFDYNYITYDFPSLGTYEVKIIFKKPQIDMQFLFHTIIYMTSIKFSETFDLEHIDISSFNTTNLGACEYAFFDVNALTSLDLSNFKNTNLMKSLCILNSIKLKYIDISSFDLSEYTDISSLISNVSVGASIVIKKKYSHITSKAGYTFIYKE